MPPQAPPLVVPVGPWMPDMPDLNNPGSTKAINVYPVTERSYGPFVAPAVYSGPLASRCQGFYTCIDDGGNVYVFAGDAADLWELTVSSTSFSKVSASAGGYSPPADDFWRFALLNDIVHATNINNPVQAFTLQSSTKFAPLATAAPQARYLAVVKNFLVLANTSDPVYGSRVQRVWWSAWNDSTNWPTPGTATAAQFQSDFQDILGDHGWCQGIVGNLGTADGAAFFEHAVWRMLYMGPPSVFYFLPAEGVKGTPAPGSIVQNGALVYYYAEDGFQRFDGTFSTPIGNERVDAFFQKNVDSANLHRIVGTVDVIHKCVIWAVPFLGNSGGNPNVLLIYNYEIDRWAMAMVTCEIIGRALTFGYTLAGLDAIAPSDELALLPYSLDSRVWDGGNIALASFDTSHQLNYFHGSNLAATVATVEQAPFGGRRGRVRLLRPLVDGGTPSVAVGVRDRQVDPYALGPAVAINNRGVCPQQLSGRYLRAEITVPAGQAWSHCQGVEVTGGPQGNQ